MIHRRSFFSRSGLGLAASTALGWAGWAATEKAKPYFEILVFRLQYGSQQIRMSNWAEKYLLPLVQKYSFGPVGFFNEQIGPNIPAFYSLFSYPSLGGREELWEQVTQDPVWRKGWEKLESGDEPPFYREDAWLLRATDYSPRLEPTSSKGDKRIYELRVYESPTYRQLRALHQRFSGPEIPIFHRSGIYPVFYAETDIGPNLPNLTYLTPFNSLAHREEAWRTFGNDPEWPPVLKASIERSGEIVRNITSVILTPTEFSMLR